MMTFEVGDLVQLKSGGPTMTVLAVSDAWVACAWFGREKSDAFSLTLVGGAVVLHERSLSAACLKRVEP